MAAQPEDPAADDGGGDRERWRRLLKRPLFWAALAVFVVFVGPLAILQEVEAHSAMASAYAASAVDAICSEWAPQELHDRLSPTLAERWSKAEVDTTVALFRSKLGTLREHSSPIGGVEFSAGTGGFGFIGRYVIPATFERGPGTVRMTIVRDGSHWRIAEFYVRAEALSK